MPVPGFLHYLYNNQERVSCDNLFCSGQMHKRKIWQHTKSKSAGFVIGV